MSARREQARRSPRAKPGAKRARILEIAVERFGRDGYDETRWADIAAAVGIGSTALYHYFESKQHCLYEIMADASAEFRDRFATIVSPHDDWEEALVTVLRNGFDLTDWEVLRLRVLTAERARVDVPSALPREEAARTSARANKRALAFAWGTFLARGMEQGLLPERDPQLLTRALFGLYNSIWTWYRPGSALELATVEHFFIGRELDLLGCAPELSKRVTRARAS